LYTLQAAKAAIDSKLQKILKNSYFSCYEIAFSMH